MMHKAQVFLSHKTTPNCLTSIGEGLIVNGRKSKETKKIPSKWTALDTINKTRFDNHWKMYSLTKHLMVYC